MLLTESRREHPDLQFACRLRKRFQTREIVSRLPSLTELTRQVGLVVGTVRHAMDILAWKHLVPTCARPRELSSPPENSGGVDMSFVIAALTWPALIAVPGAPPDRRDLAELARSSS